MAITRKAEMLAVIKSYREQQEYLILHDKKIKEIKTKYIMVFNEFNTNNSIETLAFKADSVSTLEDYTNISEQIESIHPDIRMNPFVKENYKDIYYEIMMITPTDSKEHFNVEDYKASLRKIEGIYDIILENKRKLFSVERASMYSQDALVIVDGFNRHTVKYSQDAEFIIYKSYFEEKTIFEFSKIKDFDSLFICYSTSNETYRYGEGNPIIDGYIHERHPHLVL